MEKFVERIFYLLFCAFALIGYSYFGPVEHTKFLTETAFFKNYIQPPLDKLLQSSGIESTTIGALSNVRGDINLRPSTELVFAPARSGQRLFNRTLISSGKNSSATITLLDNSQLQLAPDSTVFLDMPISNNFADNEVTLKVLGGQVTAQQSNNSRVKLKFVSSKGIEKMVKNKPIAIVSKEKFVDPNFIDEVALDQFKREEFVGSPEDAIKQLKNEPDQKLLALNTPLEVYVPATSSAPSPGLAPLKEVMSANQALSLEEIPTLPSAPPAPEVPVPSPAIVEKPPEKKIENNVAAKPKFLEPIPYKRLRKPASIPPLVKVDQPVVVPKPEAELWDKPPEGNDLSSAFYFQKKGNVEESSRLLAKAITKEGYSGERFAEGTRFIIEDYLKNYIEAKNCLEAKNTVENTRNAYPDDKKAERWASAWRKRIEEFCK